MINKNDKKKILFTEPVSDMGGVSFYILNIIKFLSRDKYEVHFAASGDGEMFNKVKNLGVITHQLPLNYNSILSFVRSIKAERALIKKENFDIVHSHTAKSGFLSAIAIKGLSCIFVYTGHGWRYLQLKNYFKRSLIFLIEKYVVFKTNAVTFLYGGESYKTDFYESYLNKSKVISFSLDQKKLEDYKSNIFSIRDRYKIPQNAFLVSMTGRLAYQKDPLTFIKTLSNLSKAIPEIYGIWMGEGELKNTVLELVKKFKLEGRVLMTGHIKNEEVFDIIGASDLMLFTSKFEGLPISVLESMAIGTPVVGANVGGMSEIIQDYNTGILFEPTDYVKASEAVLKLYGDRILMREISHNAKNIIKERFSPENRMASDFSKLYDDLINKKSPTVGAFYQCYKRPKAFFEVLKSFRNVYPNSDVMIISDNGYDYSRIANKFNCNFSSLTERSCDGRQAVFKGTEAVVSWLTRLYEAVQKIKEDYVIILEDDVLVFRQIYDLPYDLNGINPYEYIGKEVTEFLKKRNNNIPKNNKDYFYGGCGGSIIKKKFILDNFNPKDFQKIAEELDGYIKGIHEHTYFSDYWLTLFVLYYGGSVGQYKGFCEKWHNNYWSRKNIFKNISVLHQEKKYYNTSLTEEESEIFGSKFDDI